MDRTPPLDREQLHEMAVRRLGDPDVKALLLEIKQLRELAVHALERGSRLIHYTEDAHEGYLIGRFSELFEDEPAILDAYRSPLLSCEHGGQPEEDLPETDRGNSA